MNIRFFVYILLIIIFLTFIPGWVYLLPQKYVENRVIEAIKEDFFLRNRKKMKYSIKPDLVMRRYSIMPILGGASWKGAYDYSYSGKNFRAFIFINGSFCIDIGTIDLADPDRVIMPSKPHKNCFR